MVRQFKLKIPLLDLEPKNIDSKEMTAQQIEEQFLRDQIQLDFETYRKDTWEPLKHFRSKYDNEYVLSESIMSANDLTNKKKEMDKLILNSIRMCIVTEEVEKVFSYIDLLNFSQSVKLCVSLCESMN